jgi:hypothetical protein
MIFKKVCSYLSTCKTICTYGVAVKNSEAYQSYMIDVAEWVIRRWKCSFTEILLAVVYIDRLFAYEDSHILLQGAKRSKAFVTATIKRTLTLAIFLSVKYCREYQSGGLKLAYVSSSAVLVL